MHGPCGTCFWSLEQWSSHRNLQDPNVNGFATEVHQQCRGSPFESRMNSDASCLADRATCLVLVFQGASSKPPNLPTRATAWFPRHQQSSPALAFVPAGSSAKATTGWADGRMGRVDEWTSRSGRFMWRISRAEAIEVHNTWCDCCWLDFGPKTEHQRVRCIGWHDLCLRSDAVRPLSTLACFAAPHFYLPSDEAHHMVTWMAWSRKEDHFPLPNREGG